MSEEDWFERALEDAADDGSEGDEDPASDAADRCEDDDGHGGDDATDGHGGDDATDGHGGDDATDGDETAAGDDGDAAGSADAGDESVAEEQDDEPVAEGQDDEPVAEGQDDEPVAEEQDDGGLFDEGFAEALDGAESDPAGGLESGAFDQAGEGGGDLGAGGGGDGGGFGGSAGGGFGAGSSGGDLDPGAGFDGFGGGGADVPDDEELDSDIPRIDLGIEGLDEMIQGGVPERTLMVAIGAAGTGKTTFGLQFLNHGLEQGESAVYITLEETDERVIRSATEKGFAFDEYVEEGSLAVVDLDPVEMATSLQTIGGELPRLVEEFDAERLVLDSVSLLEMMYDDRAQRRNEIYDFTTALKESGVTTMLTSEASDDSPYVSRHGIVEYLTDAVFVLQYVRPSDFRETRLAIEIQKIRDANHSRETKPYEITDEGIDVYRQANLF